MKDFRNVIHILGVEALVQSDKEPLLRYSLSHWVLIFEAGEQTLIDGLRQQRKHVSRLNAALLQKQQ